MLKNEYMSVLKLKTEVQPEDYPIGVIVARFQTDELHIGQQALVDSVMSHHKKVIIFLGLRPVDKGGSRKNPLPYAAREKMIKAKYPDVVVMPIQDRRSNEDWSAELDRLIKQPFGNYKALLYGSRNSFLDHYCGKNDTTELTTDIYYSGTISRKNTSEVIPESKDWRSGVIHAVYDRYPVVLQCVDIIPYNKKDQILLGQKPTETQWRMIGGHVDTSDKSLESAAARELVEEAGIWERGGMEYVTSGQVDDWRYRGEEDGIMTAVFKCEHLWGNPQPADDIYALKWFDIADLKNSEFLVNNVVEEHVGFVQIMVDNHPIEDTQG